MDTRSDSNKPRLLSYLPSIFQAQAAREGDPVNAVLTIFEEMIGSIEDQIEKTSLQFDPDTALSEPDNNADFLSWLASWVDLTVDGEWEGQEKAAALRKKRYFIKKAAELYRYRGTAVGLKYILGAFYDVDVDILEWASPQGIEIGIASTIGTDSLIKDVAVPSDSFVVVWRPSKPIEQLIGPGIEFLPVHLMGWSEDRTLFMPILKGAEAAIDDGFARKIDKLQHQISQEKPVHTHCYLFIERPSQETETMMIEPMNIEISSTIDWNRIEE